MNQIESLDAAVRIVNNGLRVLNQRLLTLVALILDSILFGWAMLEPRWERILAAALFSIAAWCLTHLTPHSDKPGLEL